MWKWLHPYAKAETQYRICGNIAPYAGVFALLLLTIAWVWGLAFAPADYQQGNGFRMIYVHVPASIWSMGIYASMAVAAAVGLIWQIRHAYLSMIAMAPIGAVLTFLSLATGAIWGKPMWGTWWVWDARLTASLILFFLYLGILALYSAFQDRRSAAKAAAVLTLVGVVNLPIIHFSVEWWNTLHQGATITKFEKPSMATSMLIPLLLSILGFLFLSLWLTLIRYRNVLLQEEQKRPWVQALANQFIGGKK